MINWLRNADWLGLAQILLAGGFVYLGIHILVFLAKL